MARCRPSLLLVGAALLLLLVGAATPAHAQVCSVEISRAAGVTGTPLPLGVMEVQLFDGAGTRIVPINATSSTVWFDSIVGTLPPSNAIDNSSATMAATAANDPNPWLRVQYACSAGSYAFKVVVVNRPSSSNCLPCHTRLGAFYALKAYDEKGAPLVLVQTTPAGNAFTLSGELPFSMFGEPGRRNFRYVLFPANQCMTRIEKVSPLPRPDVALFINLVDVSFSPPSCPSTLDRDNDVQLGLSSELAPATTYGRASLMDASLTSLGVTASNDTNPRLLMGYACTRLAHAQLSNRPDSGTGSCAGGCSNRILNFGATRYALTTGGWAVDEPTVRFHTPGSPAQPVYFTSL